MAASAVRKTTSGELASSPAGSSSRRAITASPLPAVFSDKNANNCSVTGLHSGRCFYAYKSEVEPDAVVTADAIESVPSYIFGHKQFDQVITSEARPVTHLLDIPARFLRRSQLRPSRMGRVG